jgi:hypothetical protein
MQPRIKRTSESARPKPDTPVLTELVAGVESCLKALEPIHRDAVLRASLALNVNACRIQGFDPKPF